jgi:hypothetical protein
MVIINALFLDKKNIKFYYALDVIKGVLDSEFSAPFVSFYPIRTDHGPFPHFILVSVFM